MHSARPLPVLRRSIPGTPRFDAVGPWPYLWIGESGDIEALREGFRHLVTIAAVTQPGFVPPAGSADAVLLKQHYVFDPALPDPPLSARARARLARTERMGTFEVAPGAGACAEMIALYDGLKRRRGLEGGFFDHGSEHFEAIAALDGSVFFRVARPDGIGAMACGVVFAGMLQVLHMAMSEEGLRWNASYLLMRGLQEHVRSAGLRLLTGGMPDSGSDGLKTFKARWANRFEPVYLLRIVNDEATYAALCAATPGHGFFPAYRARG